MEIWILKKSNKPPLIENTQDNYWIEYNEELAKNGLDMDMFLE